MLPITRHAQGAIVASMPAGSFVGALMVTKLADLVGRRGTIMLSGILWVIGSILQCAAQVRYLIIDLSESDPTPIESWYARRWSYRLRDSHRLRICHSPPLPG